MLRALVVIAMQAEAAPVITSLGLEQVQSPASMPWVQCFAADDVAVAVNGVDPIHGVDSIGTTAAALTTGVAIERFDPVWVVSAGTAGGFAARGGTIGQVIVAEGPVIHHDRRVDIDGFRQYALGGYRSEPLRDLASALGFTCGPCSTGDSLDAPPSDLEAMDRHGTLAKDMEAAAVAGVAHRAGRRFTALKVITDLVDGPEPTAAEFEANLATASASLADALPRLLTRLPANV